MLVPVRVARAQPGAFESPAQRGDRFELDAYSSNYLQLFSRALMPGPGGAVVTNRAFAPAHAYFSLRVRGLDNFVSDDSLDAEVSAWGSLWFPEMPKGSPGEYDVATAHVTQRLGIGSVRIGRQLVSGGAARYVRFDGVRAAISTDVGVEVSAYAGLTALPRWDQRPGYYQLGSTADTLLVDAASTPEPSRGGYWLAGARADYHQGQNVALGLSFHEQRAERELERRQVGLDANLRLSAQADLVTAAILDVDGLRLADVRTFVDYRYSPEVLVSAEFFHVDPSLFLSRQSVLSVFSTADYDELGVEVQWRATPALRLSAQSFGQLLENAKLGGRAGIELRFQSSSLWQWTNTYRRVVLEDGGYHALRAAVRSALSPEASLVAEVYGYFYDRPVNGYLSSSVYALNGDWKLSSSVGILAGLSLLRSPYAKIDAQFLGRFSYAFHATQERN